MSPTRIVTCLLVFGCLFSVTAPAGADVNYQPYEFSDYVGDARWFQKWDGHPYDENPKGNQGLFVQWNFVKMLMESAEPAAIGDNDIGGQAFYGNIGSIAQYNSLDTGVLSDAWHDGNDTTVGYMHRDCGWFFRWFDLNNRDLEFVTSDAGVIFNDPQNLLIGFYDLDGDGVDDSFDGDLLFGRDTPGGGQIDAGDLVRQGVRFDELRFRQATQLYTVELNYVSRLPREICGAYWEPFCGVRFMQFNETFDIEGLGGIIGDMFLNTAMENRLIGPQVGVRWFRTDGRFTFDCVSRAMAAFNFISAYQEAAVGTRLAQGAGRGTDQSQTSSQLIRSRFDRFIQRETHHADHEMEIGPVVEISGRAMYHITRKFSFELGLRAMYADGIARPGNMVEYSFPTFGLNMDNTKQRVLLMGGFVGFNLNR